MALSHRLHTTIVRSLVARGRAPPSPNWPGPADATTPPCGPDWPPLADDHGMVLHPDAATRPGLGGPPVRHGPDRGDGPPRRPDLVRPVCGVRPGWWRWSPRTDRSRAHHPGQRGRPGPARRRRTRPGPLPGLRPHRPRRALPDPDGRCLAQRRPHLPGHALFATAGNVDDWCTRRGVARGAVEPVARVWRFGREWYGRHVDDDWRKWTVTEAAAIFARHGLVGPTWDLPVPDDEAAERF